MARKRYPVVVLSAVALFAAAAFGKGELPSGATVVVAPLTRAMWNQGRHFNLMCPLTDTGGNDGRLWAGCTAVATAIIMDHYQWPLQGTGDTRYYESYWQGAVTNQCARFDSEYDWAAMRDAYGHVVSARESLAVGTLLADVGAVLNMNYGPSGSSTQFINVQEVLGKNFHYDNSYARSVRDFSGDELAAVIEELRNGFPIPCSGAANASGVGHTYVCDGCATTSPAAGAVTNLFHFNFGWGGSGNGWYPLDAVFTTAIPGQPSSSQKVDEMYLGVHPKKVPQFAAVPMTVGSALTSRWAVATCWTNTLAGFMLERQRLAPVAVNEAILPGDWTMHMMSDDPLGWIVGDTTVSGKIYSFWGSCSWPGMDNALCSTKAVSISSETVITIEYRALKLPSGVSLRLATALCDEGVHEWADRDPVTYDYTPTLATLPCGTSTSSLTSHSVTLKGSDLIKALGGPATEVHLAIGVYDPDWVGTTFAADTEIFRLESLTVSGTAEDWTTVDERALASDVRSAAFVGLEEGRHRFKLTARYGETAATGTQEIAVSESVRPPAIRVVETNENSVVFEVGGAEDFEYGFEVQSRKDLAGRHAVAGDRVTYAFDRAGGERGTHWLTLTVTNRKNQLVSKFVHIVNPPEDHPLCAYAENTIDAAIARGLKEGKPVLLLSTGDPEASKFDSVSEFLASNALVSAIAENYVLVEASGIIPEDYETVRIYWREQSVGMGFTPNPYDPTRYGYAIVIDPRSPGQPIPKEGALNSQKDFSFMSVAQLVVDPLKAFLAQDFNLGLRPEDEPIEAPVITGFEVGGTVSVEVKTEPGLRYTLLRFGGIGKLSGGVTSVAADWSVSAVADGVTLTLVDPAPPAGRAIYAVTVSKSAQGE